VIDALVAAQGINSAAIDPFASGEANAPFPNMVPLFATVVVDGPAVVVRSFDDGGRHNKAGNHAFLRFTPVATGIVRVTVSTSNAALDADPDFVVYRGALDGGSGGGRFVIGNDPPPQPEIRELPVTAGRTYVIDAFDCANGCGLPWGTPGDYELTVTVSTVN
jgi:hypothetical protein